MLTELHIENLGVIERLDLRLGPGMTASPARPAPARRCSSRRSTCSSAGGPTPRSCARGRRGAGRRALRRRRRRGRVVRVVPADGRSRAYVDGRPATVARSPSWPPAGRPPRPARPPEPARRPPSGRARPLRRASTSAAARRRGRRHRDRRRAGRPRRRRAHRARRSTCCASRSPSSTPPRSTTPTRTSRWRPRRTCSPTPSAHREAGAAAHDALADDGGAREASPPPSPPSPGRRRSPSVADRLAASLAELDDVAAELRAIGEAIEEDPGAAGRGARAPPAARDLCRKYGDDARRGDGLPRRGGAPPRRAERFEQRAAELDAAAGGGRSPSARPAPRPRPRRRERRRSWPRRSTSARDAGDAARRRSTSRSGRRRRPRRPVQFLLSANPGAPLLPLSQGGLRRRAGPGDAGPAPGADAGRPRRPATLVFDEVDAGIGGGGHGRRRGRPRPSSAEPPGARRHPPRPGRRAGDHAGRGHQDRRRRVTTATVALSRRRRPGRPRSPACSRVDGRRRRPPTCPRAAVA